MQDCHWIKKPSVRVMLGLLLCIFTIAANAAWANATEASQATVQPATRTVASFPTGTAAPARTIVPSDMAAPVETVAPIATIASDATGTIAGEEQIPLFDDTLLLTQPRNTANVGFWLIPNTVLGDDIALSLHLEASDTLIDARSTITLSLNGESLSTSRILDIVNNRQGSWETRIPKRLIRTDGRENVLTVLTMQRSIEGDSQDIDNPSNWVKLLSDSYFQLNIARQGTFQLSNVYDSFFHRMEEGDTLTVGFILDDTKRMATLGSMLRFSSAAGALYPKKSTLQLQASQFGAADPSLQNYIRIGLFAVQCSGDKQNSVKSPQTGYLMTEREGSRLGLTISSADDVGLAKAINFLVRKDLLESVEGSSVFVTNDPGIPTEPVITKDSGVYQLSDFGYPTTMLSGAFHQQGTFTLAQPNGKQGGARSYIQLHYRHSQTLISDQSLMTVYLNGNPLGSVKLSVSNANDGTYKVTIPKDALAAQVMTLRVETYHYLGTVDCSKDYSDTAWTSIEADSTVYLEPSDTMIRPTLASFPNFPCTDGSTKAIMVIPNDADASTLTIAAAVAMRAGQNSRYPITWEAVTANQLSDQPQENLFIFGSAKTTGMPAAISNSLPIKMDTNGQWIVQSGIPIAPETVPNKIICQVVRSPWNINKRVYVMLYSDGMEDVVLRALEGKNALQVMDDHIALIDKDGKITTFAVYTEDENQEIPLTLERMEYLWENQTGMPFWLLPVVLLLLALGIFQIVRIARHRNRLRDSANQAGLAGTVERLSPPEIRKHDLDL